MTGISIVCIGDSITNGHHGTVSYPTYLGQIMTWATVTNKGIDSNSTTQQLARFTTDVIDLNPDYVVILGGIVDIILGDPLATTESNLEDMYEAAIAAGITPILCKILPAVDYSSTNIAALNTWIENYATTNSLICVDLHTAMQDPYASTHLKPSYDSGDGLHPCNDGYLNLARAVFNKAFLPDYLRIYEKRAVFDVTDSPSLYGYQTQLSLSWLTGMAADFSDIAFTDASDNAGIPWGIMPGSLVSGTSCTVWLALPAGVTTVHCYYGCTDAPDLDNLGAVFEHWDDFLESSVDTSRWTATGGSATLSGGVVTVYNACHLHSIATFAGGYAVLTRADLGSTHVNLVGWCTLGSVYIAHMYHYPTDGVINATIHAPADTSNNEGAQSGYHVYEILRPVTGDVVFKIDGAGSNSLSNDLTSAITASIYAATSGTVLVDYFAVRKYAATEPSIAYDSTGDNPLYDSQETILESSIDKSAAVGGVSLAIDVTFKSTATEPAIVNILTSRNGTDWTTEPELQYDIPVSAGNTVRHAFVYLGAGKYIRAVLVDDLINPGVDSASSDYYMRVAT